MQTRNWLSVVWVGVLSAFCFTPRILFASCGQAFCPIETATTTERHPHSGELQFNLTYEFIDLDDPYIGTGSARVGEIPRAHDEQFTRNHTVKFSLDYGITPRLTIGVLLPFLDRLHQHLAHEEEEVVGGSEETEIVDETERWRYQEPGDIQITGRYLLLPPITPLSPPLSFVFGTEITQPGQTPAKSKDVGESIVEITTGGTRRWSGHGQRRAVC
jgi:hypothetical protein